MTTASPLELKLRQVDLRFRPVDEDAHLAEERLALITGGVDPLEAEAAHLAACDACLDVLLALGEGLEALGESWAVSATTEPAATATTALPKPAPSAPASAPVPTDTRPGKRTRFGVILGGLGFAFAAAAAVGIQAFRTPEPSAVAVAQAEASPSALPIRRSALPPPPEPVVLASAPAIATPAFASEPARPSPPAASVAEQARAAQRPESIRPGAVATTVGEIDDREAATFNRAPVNAPGRGFGFLRLSARPQAQVFIDDKPYGWTPLFDLRLQEGAHDVRLVYTHPDAAQPEEKFRVVIPAEEHWVVKRLNLRAAAP